MCISHQDTCIGADIQTATTQLQARVNSSCGRYSMHSLLSETATSAPSASVIMAPVMEGGGYEATTGGSDPIQDELDAILKEALLNNTDNLDKINMVFGGFEWGDA